MKPEAGIVERLRNNIAPSLADCREAASLIERQSRALVEAREKMLSKREQLQEYKLRCDGDDEIKKHARAVAEGRLMQVEMDLTTINTALASAPHGELATSGGSANRNASPSTRTNEQVLARIAEIDEMFQSANGWGSWMAEASKERFGLVRDLAARGIEVADQYVITHAAPSPSAGGEPSSLSADSQSFDEETIEAAAKELAIDAQRFVRLEIEERPAGYAAHVASLDVDGFAAIIPAILSRHLALKSKPNPQVDETDWRNTDPVLCSYEMRRPEGTYKAQRTYADTVAIWLSGEKIAVRANLSEAREFVLSTNARAPKPNPQAGRGTIASGYALDGPAAPAVSGEGWERARELLTGFELVTDHYGSVHRLDEHDARQITDWLARHLSRKGTPDKEIVEALEFYANPEIYKPHPDGLAFDRRDLSHAARAALLKLRSRA